MARPEGLPEGRALRQPLLKAVPYDYRFSRERPLGRSVVAPPLRQRRKRLEHLVVIRLVPRVVENFAVPDHAARVDDEYAPLGDALQADHVLVEHAVIADHLLVEVTQQG